MAARLTEVVDSPALINSADRLPSDLQYDLIVIGSGAGNIVVDAALAAGKRVALIEKQHWGGTCLNRGCIPTKILLSPADRVRSWESDLVMGMVGSQPTIDWPTVARRMTDKILENRVGVVDYYSGYENCSLYHGKASLVPLGAPDAGSPAGAAAGSPAGANAGSPAGAAAETAMPALDMSSDADAPKAVDVLLPDGKTASLTASRVVIAAGGRSKVPRIEGIDNADYLTSELFFGSKFPDVLPRSVIMVGGADIGCEFAHFFASYGAEVTIVQHNVRLIPKQDEAVSAQLLKGFEHQGVRVIFNQDTTRIEDLGQVKRLHFRDRATSEEAFAEAEAIFFSAGILPFTDELGAAKAGVATDSRGWIRTNEYLETTRPGVYAIGDINGRAQLRHKANYEAEILGRNLYARAVDQPAEAARYDVVPSATFTFPQSGKVGLTEKQARDAGLKIRVAVHPYSAVIKTYALGIEAGSAEDGFVKLIVEEGSDRLLGMHVVGHEAAILVQGVAWLMNAGDPPAERVLEPEIETAESAVWRKAPAMPLRPNKLEALTHAMTIHPALSEVVGWAPGLLE